MTESLGVTAMPIGANRPGSCGKILPFTSVKVVDPLTGTPLGPRQKGLLYIKGGLIMKGYADNDEATNKVIDKNRWFSSGDIGYYDEDGYFHIVGRLKELIKQKGGYVLAPGELEAILLSHPKITDAAVVGFRKKPSGQLPFAFVVKQQKEKLTKKEVKKFITEHVSHHKQLQCGVLFVHELQRNSEGKLMRKRMGEFLRIQQCKI